ncbi:MAG: short-chain dehydrogenase [Frankiales bacterium]|nr:short-chain dehydrogenase [Frankiales bacterium]
MPVALITGPTSGIGRAFALQLAARGLDIVLVARDEGRLESLAADLRARFGVATEVIVADLTDRSDLARVEERLRAAERPVHTLINNAGFASGVPFGEASTERIDSMIALHVTAVTHLTHAALPGMRARKSGLIITVASVAGLLPGTSSPPYGATKAFDIALMEGLAGTLKGSGVRVVAVCPGLTRTEFHERAGMDLSGLPRFVWLSPHRVVSDALRAAARGIVISIPTKRYRYAIRLAAFVPRELSGAFVRARDPRA